MNDPSFTSTSNPDIHQKFLIVILGPTAIGKTDLAVELAQTLKTEIISADSRQFYRELNIGVAKPEVCQLEAVKHHFIAHLSITEEYNVYRYETDVLKLLDQLFTDHKYVILVGGSGLYIDAVCRGIDVLPDADQKLREELNGLYRKKGIKPLQEKLAQLDPEYYQEVDVNNPKRLMRAIEVCMASGKKYSELRLKHYKTRDFNTIKIGLNCDRKLLFERIEQRVDLMIDEGLLDEVQSLVPYKNTNALNTVGYKEIFRCLDNEIDFEQAVTDIKTNTRRYAKRQLVWFKRDPEIIWTEPGDPEEVLKMIRARS